MIQLLKGDCLIESDKIESGSVDLILTDLPYGNMNGAALDGWKDNKTSWDIAIEPKKIFEIANRILRKNGKMVLFSQEPYTSRMTTEAIANVPFNFRMIWEKDHFANALISKKAPVSYFEDVLVFSKNHQKHDFEGMHPLRPYFKQVFEFIGGTKKNIIEKIGQRADHTFRFNSTQYGICTEKTYLKLIEVFGIYEMPFFKSFEYLKKIDTKYRTDLLKQMNEQYPSTFNLWEGNKFKSNILKYKKDYTGHHPTQKPVLLLEDLIKTFSNENDLVLDFTMGSGSTGVACVNTNRNFTGIETNKDYFNIAKKRLNK
tara:strand:- start:63 stop:1007 length:945 start_codon:yes stop_codon:yes gene_type:complete